MCPLYELNVNRLLSVLAFLGCGCGLAARAANPGDEVVIVYNTRVPESKEVADYYAAAAPGADQPDFRLALSTNEDMSRKEFRNDLQKPLAQALKKRKALANRPDDRPGHDQPPWPGRVETR